MKKCYSMGALVLDITLSLRSGEILPITDIFVQGKVTELNQISFYMGGSVGNTGLALHKLGVNTVLSGKVGRDTQGEAIKSLISGAGAPYHLIEMDGVPTTTSIAVTPKGLDKITLFMKGASQTYSGADADGIKDADLFHFGYPVTMKGMYADEGAGLLQLMSTVKATGASTSMDTALPRPDGEHGKINWRPILKKVLPYVDAFVPSYEECLFMLDREDYIEKWQQAAGGDMIDLLTEDSVRRVAEEFLGMGTKIVFIKLGSRGAYLRTADRAAFAGAGRAFSDLPENWYGRELWIFPNKVPKIVSTTGAGDTCIAGFLAAALRGESPEKALQIGSTAASLCIQSADTTSLLTSYEAVEAAAAGAERTAGGFALSDSWRRDEAAGLYIGKNDGRF